MHLNVLNLKGCLLMHLNVLIIIIIWFNFQWMRVHVSTIVIINFYCNVTLKSFFILWADLKNLKNHNEVIVMLQSKKK